MTGEQVLGILSSGGVVAVIAGAIAFIGGRRKNNAEASGALTSAAVAKDSQIDAHWSKLVEAQASAIVAPLRGEVEALRIEVRDLRTEIEKRRDMYWRAIQYIRDLIGIVEAYRGQAIATGQPSAPAIPDPPPSIVEDI